MPVGETQAAGASSQVLQFPPDDEDVEPCGGLYVDLPVTDDNSAADNSLTAYGADIILKEYALES